MRVLVRESGRRGAAAVVLRELEAGWLRALFGERVHPLEAPAGEQWGVLPFGPLEIALGFRRDAEAADRLGFTLVHGPFSRFHYDVAVRQEGDVARVSETVTLGLPSFYGGDAATRWIAARLFPRFAEERP